MKRYVGLFLMYVLLGCASNSRTAGEVETYGFKDDGGVWVRGPWDDIKPSKDADEVIDQLCPAIMRLPGANWGSYGQEYCGAIYLLDGIFYSSHPSPLGAVVRLHENETRKRCKPPREVVDPRGQLTIIGDFHSHPWPNNRMSQADRRGPTNSGPFASSSTPRAA